MAQTTSLSFPNMFNVSRNTVGVIEDTKSVVNRCRLLMLTDPTELYHSPTFGVGLKRYLWQYNTENTKAQVKSRIVDQLREFEPCVKADDTKFVNGLLYSGSSDAAALVQDANKLELTVGLSTIFGDIAELSISEV